MLFAAYAGLPLLYTAFNTFAPVHNVILRGISFVSGGTAGSPLDATDSLVIPLAMSIAVWVWRRPTVSTERLRLHWGLLAAAVAALASVATSYPGPEYGIREVGVSPDGTIHAYLYESSDGGFTWARDNAPRGEVRWGSQSAETPAGTYTIGGPGIRLLYADGKRELAYSTAYLAEEANMWVQEQATTHLDIRKVTTRPYGLVYDENSGNLIAAMGIQGVLVGTPDGRWTRVAVGRYTPTDFSFSGKTGQLLSNYGFWAGALALALAMTGIGLLASRYRTEDVPLLLGVVLATLALLVGAPAVLVIGGSEKLLEGILTGALVALVGLSPLLLVAALIAGGIALGNLPPESRVRQSLGLMMAIPSLMASAALVLLFGDSDAVAFSYYGLREIAVGVPAFVMGFAVMAVSWRQLRHWRVLVPAFLGMNTLVVFTFMLWLHLDMTLSLAKLSAIVLTALAAMVLAAYMKRLQQPG